jgi:hypothetical protein
MTPATRLGKIGLAMTTPVTISERAARRISEILG